MPTTMRGSPRFWFSAAPPSHGISREDRRLTRYPAPSCCRRYKYPMLATLTHLGGYAAELHPPGARGPAGPRRAGGPGAVSHVPGDLAEPLAPAPVAGRVEMSSGAVPTKFHHISTGWPSGTPPSRNSRRRPRPPAPPVPAPAAGTAGCPGQHVPAASAVPATTNMHVLEAPAPGRAGRVRASPAPQLGPHDRGEHRAGDCAPASDPTNTVTPKPPSPATGSPRDARTRADLPVRLGQRHPELNPVQPRVMLAGDSSAVRDPPPGGHQVELAGPDHLLAAQAVPVQHVAREQPGHGLQPDMRMRRDLHPGYPVHRHRPVVVDEAPGPHAAPRRNGSSRRTVMSPTRATRPVVSSPGRPSGPGGPGAGGPGPGGPGTVTSASALLMPGSSAHQGLDRGGQLG